MKANKFKRKMGVMSEPKSMSIIRLFFMAMPMLCLMLIINVLPAKSTEVLSAEIKLDGVTATRYILTSESISPGSTFSAMIMLHVNTEINQLELHEDLPKGWTTNPVNNADAEVTFSPTDPSKISWIWKDIHPGTFKTIFYHVTVPLSAEEKNYRIETEIILSNGSNATGGGEIAVSVKKSTDSTENNLSLELAVFIALIIIAGFFVIIFLGWWQEKRIDKGVMRRAMAGTFVIGYTFVVMLSMWSGNFQKEVVLMYVQLVSVVVAFYFGAKVARESLVGAGEASEPPAPSEPPTVNSITPSEGNGTVTVTIKGTGFVKGAQIKLSKPGHDDIIVPIEDEHISPTEIASTLNLTGKAGTWYIFVVNPDKEKSNTVNFKVV